MFSPPIEINNIKPKYFEKHLTLISLLYCTTKYPPLDVLDKDDKHRIRISPPYYFLQPSHGSAFH
jgi:hypothetical protein